MLHGKTTMTRHDHVYNNTSTSTDVRGALSWGGGATRVSPGQYPQYTRADFGQEAVGCSLHRDHRRP